MIKCRICFIFRLSVQFPCIFLCWEYSADILFAVQNQPFLKLLSMLVELPGGPPGMPPFMNYVLQKFWEVKFLNDSFHKLHDVCSLHSLHYVVSSLFSKILLWNNYWKKTVGNWINLG